MVKQLAVNIMRGLTITHISLPVRIFEPRTSLHRIADLFSFVPKYLRRASESSDPTERFKNVVASVISVIYICTGQLKPFNPILGETL